MSAYIKHVGRKYYFDMTNIKADYTFLHANACSRRKQRELKRLDPYAHRVGQHLRFRTPEDLQKHIDKYFESCMTKVRNKDGALMLDEDGEPLYVQSKPYTLSGLALHLGITTATLRTYRNKSRAGLIRPEYADIILTARQRIEEYAEGQLYSRDGNRGGEFVLRAGFGWRTKSERNSEKITKKKMKMQLEEQKLKSKLIQQGLDEADTSVEIKITRASERNGEKSDDNEE